MEDGESVLYNVTVLRSMYEVSSKTLFVCNDVSYGMNAIIVPTLRWICSKRSFLLRHAHTHLTSYSTLIMNNATTLPTPPTQAGYYEGDEFIPGTQIDLLEAFSKVLREKRYMVRENFTYDPSQQGKAAMVLEQLQVEVDNMRSGLTRWCKTHYGEAFVAWMHIKVIRVFVESVLRYGLPVDFTAVLYKVVSGKEVLLVNALDKKFGVNKGKEEEDVEDDEEYHDFVLIKFDP